MPVVMMPMRVLTMKMPPSVTMSIASRNPTVPSSPPIVPGSSVRRRLKRQSVGKSEIARSLARSTQTISGDRDDDQQPR